MAHLSNVFPLMISYKVHVQSSCRKKKNPCSILGTKNNLQRCPAEGALAHRAVSFVLHAVSFLLSATLSRKKELNLDFLGGRKLRDGFLDPQSCESGRWVCVPALSH